MKNLLMCLLACIAIVTAWVADAAPLPIGIAIDFKGEPKDITDLIAKIMNDSLNKNWRCEKVNDSTLACAKVGPKLYAFLDKNTPKTLTWSTSNKDNPKPCPGTVGCQIMRCPPNIPGSQIMCCYKTPPYAPC